MASRKSALTKGLSAEPARHVINRMLSAIANKSDEKTQSVIRSTALEFLPFGSVNGEACFPPGEPAFVLIDTGVMDFSGNNSAIYASLQTDDPILNDQEVLDYLFASALIYFERCEQWESRRDAIFAPKMNYSEIPARLISRAMGHAVAVQLFFALHELAHVLLANEDLDSVNLWSDAAKSKGSELSAVISSQFEENMADIIAFDWLINFATFCVPEPRMGVNILSGVDIALTFMMFFQSAFPISRGGGALQINEYADHPAAFQRRHLFRARVKERMNLFSERLELDFLSEGAKCEELLFRFMKPIHEGIGPSAMFHIRRQLAIERFQ